MSQTRQSFVPYASLQITTRAFFHRFSIALVNITGQRLAIDLRRLHIQKDVTESEVSREVEYQLAALDSDPSVPRGSAEWRS